MNPTATHSNQATLGEVVSGIAKGQQWAQVALYDRLFEPAYYTAYRMLKNQMAAEDAVHEAFIRAFAKIGLLKDPELIEGWFKRIVLNEALQGIRANKVFSDEPIIEPQADEAEVIELPTIGELHGCIEALPEGYRVISQLHWIEEMKHEEIGEMLGISTSTSRSQLTRARAKLKEVILQKGLLK